MKKQGGLQEGKYKEDADRFVEPVIAYEGNEDEDDDFVWKAMQKAYDPHTNMVTDISIDTSDLPMAKNVYDFCKNIAGKNIKMPFSRQLWMMYMLMSEWCPRCSSPEIRDITNIPVDEDAEDAIYDGRLVLLEDGVCPKCQASRSQLILRGELNDYNEAVWVLGQRAGKSSTSTVLSSYQLHKLLKSPKLSTICRGIQDFSPLTGSFVALSASRSIKLLWNPFMEVIKASDWFCLAEGTQIELSNGTTKSIEDVKVGDSVSTFEGSNFVDRVFDNGSKECLEVTLESGRQLIGTNEHQVQCLAPNGHSLIWKNIGDLTDDDYVVEK